MKNYILTFLLVVFVVLASVTVRKALASGTINSENGTVALGIGPGPVPIPPHVAAIGPGPVPIPPHASAIGPGPVPIPPHAE